MIRIPVTQEFLADCIAAEARGEIVYHPANAFFKNALYEDMNKLVHKIAHKFKITINESEEEISQNCFYHLFKRISRYRSSKGRFSTFSTWVCTNYLKGYYLKDKRYHGHFTCISDVGENQEGSFLIGESGFCKNQAHNSLLRQDIASTIRELLTRYPEKSNLTIGIFGNPSEIEKGTFNEEIRLSAIRGYTKKEKEKFFYSCVVPLFRERLGGIYA